MSAVTAKIAVIGTGYVGLTTGVCLASLGNDVACVDVDPGKVERLQRGEMPILEDGLGELMRDAIAAERLRFYLGPDGAIEDREFVFLCVPTPQGEDGSADLSYVEAAATQIAPLLRPGAVVINKSTVPVGSTRVVERALQRNDVSVVSNPEFLREGSAVQDFLHPDRVVIGADDQAAAGRVARLYEGLGAPIQVTDPASAETIKYACNAFLATKLSFINAVAAVCEGVGADVNDVVLGMGYDKRIGHEFLRPGPGWGGSCFPKDSIALIRIAAEGGYDFRLLKGVIEVNDEQFRRVAARIRVAAGGSLDGVKVAMLGLTFKAGTDDLRDSPALAVAELLVADGAIVVGYDPAVAVGTPVDGVEVAADPYAAADGAGVLALLTEWDEFKWLDFDRIGEAMSRPSVVDTRNVLDRQVLLKAGFDFHAVGRG